MLVKKSMLINFIALGILSVSTFAIADNLTIVNNTYADSTSVLNGGPCSDILGESGIAKKRKPDNVVNEEDLKKGCKFNMENCAAEVHMTNNCTGPVVAIVTFSVKKGIKTITPRDTSEGYVVSGRPNTFVAYLDGGPKPKSWLQQFLGG